MPERSEPRYKVVDNVYIQLTPEEIQELADRAAEADLDFTTVRHDRNAKLSHSDWTQIADAKLGVHAEKDDDGNDVAITVAEWATYRQELRDLPTGFSKVSEVVWPTPPE